MEHNWVTIGKTFSGTLLKSIIGKLKSITGPALTSPITQLTRYISNYVAAT